MNFYTADEHYGHSNVIKPDYSNRPFDNIDEMNHALIVNHNSIVTSKDTTYHIGDFTLRARSFAEHIISQLNGNHIFVLGSHDYWLKKKSHYIMEHKFQNAYIIMCHYKMTVWPRSHYNSWLLYGHSHGKLLPTGKQLDVGVDNNNYFPFSFSAVKEHMENQPDNFNYIKKSRHY